MGVPFWWLDVCAKVQGTTIFYMLCCLLKIELSFRILLIIFVFASGALSVSRLSMIRHRENKWSCLHYNKDTTTHRYCWGRFILIKRINYYYLTGITWCSLKVKPSFVNKREERSILLIWSLLSSLQ